MMRRILSPRSSRPHRKCRSASYGLAVNTIGETADCSLPLSARDCGAIPLADRLDKRKRPGTFFGLDSRGHRSDRTPQWGPRKVGRLFGARRNNGMNEPCCLAAGRVIWSLRRREPSESPRHFAASMDESVIVGYYTLKKCLSKAPRPSQILSERSMTHGKK